jgi:hypothetical protein
MEIEEQSGSSPELGNQDTQVIDEPSTPGETETSLLSVVQSVVEKSAEQSAPASDTESPPEGQSQTAAPERAEDEQSEDYSKLPFNEHPRFKKLVAQKHAFRAQAEANEQDAKQYRDIQAFMETNGLTAEEVAQSLDMLAKMKSGDPAEAYELMQQRMQSLAVMAGKQLPADLEEKVEQGYIDRDTAQDLHQQRVGAERKAQLAQSQLDRMSQQDQRSQVNAMASAVSAWEQATKSSDPDFDLKAELVKDRVRAHVASHGMPKNSDEALKLSKEAYESVTQTLLRARGDRTPMRTAVGGKTNGSAQPEPKSLLDVIRRASAGA